MLLLLMGRHSQARLAVLLLLAFQSDSVQFSVPLTYIM